MYIIYSFLLVVILSYFISVMSLFVHNDLMEESNDLLHICLSPIIKFHLVIDMFKAKEYKLLLNFIIDPASNVFVLYSTKDMYVEFKELVVKEKANAKITKSSFTDKDKYIINGYKELRA